MCKNNKNKGISLISFSRYSFFSNVFFSFIHFILRKSYSMAWLTVLHNSRKIASIIGLTINTKECVVLVFYANSHKLYTWMHFFFSYFLNIFLPFTLDLRIEMFKKDLMLLQICSSLILNRIQRNKINKLQNSNTIFA